jgi:peptide/nickel transport system substrate-binding protein
MSWSKSSRIMFKQSVTRRSFYLLLGLLVFALAQAQPAQFNEAPMLAERVEAGELPPVEERLPDPEDVMVLEPVEQIGQYGGTIRTFHPDPGMGKLKMWMYDPPVRWNRDYTEYIPGLFRDWEFNEDGTVLTYYMRRGVKWSDGEPFTTEDILFWWEDMAANPDVGTLQIPWWGYVGELPPTVEIIDDYTFSITFAGPNYNAPFILASGFWNWEDMMTPKHYLSQFHPEYNDEVDGYGDLETVFRQWHQTPGYPTLFAWHTVLYQPGERVAFERNPYYWKVDTEGNQLPYVDRIESREVPDEEVRVLQIIGGEIDLSFRGAESPRNLPVILDNEERGGYRWIEGWLNGAGGWPAFVVNQDFVGDDYIHGLLRDKNFRRALSLALDREEINEAVWFGLGTIQQGTISEQSWHFDPPEGRQLFEEWAAWYADFDPEQANELMDAAGLDQRDGQGMRLRADNGQRFQLMIDVGEWGGPAVATESSALAQRHWQQHLGIEVILNQAPAARIQQNFEVGEYMLRPVHIAEMDLWTFPDWVFPIGREFRAWPQQARWFQTGGQQGVEPDEIVQRLYALYAEGLTIEDAQDRHHLVWEAIRIHMEEGPFFIGVAGRFPMPAIANVNLRNIPDFGILGPWATGGPGNTNPEQYFFNQP